MLAGAMDTMIDKQGRIMIPDYLRKYAGISKKQSSQDCTIVLKSGMRKMESL